MRRATRIRTLPDGSLQAYTVFVPNDEWIVPRGVNMSHKYQTQIDDLRNKRRKVNSNISKEISELMNGYSSHVKLSGNRFSRVDNFLKKVDSLEDAIRGLKDAGKALA